MLTVVTFNMHAGVGTDRKYDLDRISSVLKHLSPHLIGLNEVDYLFHRRSNYEDSIKVLAGKLGMQYAYGPAIYRDKLNDIEKGAYGNALLSSFPIIEYKHHVLPHFSKGEARTLLSAKVNTNAGEIRVGVTHLSLLERYRRRQVNEIMNVLPGDDPTIIMGDMNAKERHLSMIELRKKYSDTWREKGSGNGYTFSSRKPRLRLDYIYCSRHFSVEEATVIEQAGEASDHLPLSVLLRQT